MKRFFLSLFLASLVLAVSAPLTFSEPPLQQPVMQPALEDRSFREERVYVPYEKLDEVLQKKEKGIFIPYSDFLKLWEEATKTAPDKEKPVPPIDAAIIHAEYKGNVLEDVVEFHAELKISALKEKWAKIFLNFKNIALTSATLNDQSPLLSPAAQGLELVLPEKGSYVLKLDFSTKVQTIPGKKFIEFELPASPLTRVDLTIPGKDLDVKVEPMLSMKTNVVEDRTEFSSFISPEGKVNISWLSKTAETKAAKNLFFAKLFSELSIKESVYSIETQIDFSVMQAKTDNFKIRIPKALNLVKVEGKNIKDWDVKEDGTLQVNLFEEISGAYTLTVGMEKLRDAGEKSFDFQPVEVVDAMREEGVVAIKSDPDLKIKAEKLDMVTQIDPSEIKDRISTENLVSAYKYFRRPFTVSLGISRIQPKIRGQQNIVLSIGETIIDYRTKVDFAIRDAGVFEFRFVMPENFRVVEVGSERAVDSFAVEKTEDKNILKVVLKNKAYGQYSLPIRLEADKEDKDVSFDLPKLVCLDVEKEEGAIAISLRKNLKLSTDSIKSLRPVSLEELGGLGFQEPDERNEIAAGYRYATNDYACRLGFEKRSTKIMAVAERNVSVEETAMKMTDTVRYEILYAPVSRFRIEVPASAGKDAVITGDNIKEKKFMPDEKLDRGVWEIELHAPRMNSYVLRVSMEKKLPEIKIGEKRNIAVPDLKVLDVFNESGFVSIGKSPSLQVDAAAENLEPIDVKELPASMDKSQSVLAFRYLAHPYSLSLESTKHEYEKVLDAIVNHAHFDIVFSDEGIAKTEGVFRIQNSNRQSLEIMLPKGTENIYSVFISGKKASISKGSSERSKIIMLPKDIEPGREFTVRIIYETKARKKFGFFGGFRVGSAEILDIPTSKVSWRLYLPVRYSYLYMKGTMNPRSPYDYRYNDIISSISSGDMQEYSNVSVDAKGIPAQGDEQAVYGLDVQIVREGRLFLFSKLDKDAGLRVLYMKKVFLYNFNFILFAAALIAFIYVPVKKKWNRAAFIAYSLAAAYIVRLFLPQGFKYFAMIVFGGSAFAGITLLLLSIFGGKKPSSGKGEGATGETSANKQQ